MSVATRYPRAVAVVVALFVGAVMLSAFAPAVLGQVAPAQQLESGPVADRDGCAGPAEPLLRTELYFGSNKPDRTVVTEAQFQRFLNEEITPRFPDRLTLLAG